MDGTAVNEIEKLTKKGLVVDVNGKTFSANKMEAVFHDPRPSALKVFSLDALLEYIKSNNDLQDHSVMIHVKDPGEVELITEIYGDLKKRDVPIYAVREQSGFPFDEWVEQERFIILCRSLFDDTKDLQFILSHTAKIDTEAAIKTEDDGITQAIRVRKGVSGALTEARDIKPVVLLKPHRTFSEVDQPESEFLFRMKESNATVYCALYAADNGEWKNVARKNIAEYLKDSGLPILA